MRAYLIIFILTFTIFNFSYSNNRALSEKTASKKEEDKILYYTCGMHPQTRVSVEEYKKGKTKDPICGMDLVPVYASSVAEKGVVKLTQEEASLASIETTPVKILPLFKEIRTVGVVAYDPILRKAEEEYLAALETYKKVKNSSFSDAKKRAEDILSSAKLKLKLLGFTESWFKELEARGSPEINLIFPDKYMWVYADIYEYEVIWPKIGDEAVVIPEADPSLTLKGTIKAIEPVVKENTRTLKLKIIVENKNNILKPNMYVDVFLKNKIGKKLAIPYSAVLDTGRRKIAFVDLGEGRYQLREIKIGPQVAAIVNNQKKDFYILTEGIKQGERVVVKGNYLLDSQSQLGAAGTVYGGALGAEDKKNRTKSDALHMPQHHH